MNEGNLKIHSKYFWGYPLWCKPSWVACGVNPVIGPVFKTTLSLLEWLRLEPHDRFSLTQAHAAAQSSRGQLTSHLSISSLSLAHVFIPDRAGYQWR